MAELGRPSVVTPEVIQKLEQAFSIGCTDSEASFYAGIGEASLYRYCEEHPEFRERKEGLKDLPVITARQTVVRALKHDQNMSMTYLKGKRKREFSERIESDITTQDKPIGELTFDLVEMADEVAKKLKERKTK